MQISLHNLIKTIIINSLESRVAKFATYHCPILRFLLLQYIDRLENNVDFDRLAFRSQFCFRKIIFSEFNETELSIKLTFLNNNNAKYFFKG